jgi:dTDP-4-amino-4,6-dideoxygalactose transaminase
MDIPLLDLGAQNEPLREQILSAIDQVIRSHAFILGPEVQRLEERIAAYCKARFAVGVTSGTDALLVSLMALGVGRGDEVITTPFSFFATAGVIARLGATPVFVDVDPQTYNIDAESISGSITERTKAILPVHLFGQCADMAPILEVARARRIPVIEDAAQAIGAEYRDGRRAGSMGDVGCFSFYPSKNLGAMGDAGMVVTNDAETAEKLKVLRVHGSQPKYYHHMVGGNFRLDSVQAAVLNVKFGHLDEWTKGRRKNAAIYDALFADNGLLELVSRPHRAYTSERIRHDHIFNQYVIRVPRRDDLRQHLKEKGIGSEVYYPVPLHLQQCFQYLGYKEEDFPEAERAAKETLALPVYPEITEAQKALVVRTIRNFYLGEEGTR